MSKKFFCDLCTRPIGTTADLIPPGINVGEGGKYRVELSIRNVRGAEGFKGQDPDVCPRCQATLAEQLAAAMAGNK